MDRLPLLALGVTAAALRARRRRACTPTRGGRAAARGARRPAAGRRRGSPAAGAPPPLRRRRPPAAPHPPGPRAGSCGWRPPALDLTPGRVLRLRARRGRPALWLVAGVALAPFFGPIAALLGRLGGVRLPQLAAARSASSASSTNSPSSPASSPTPPRPASPCAPPLGMAAEELEAPAGEELAKVADQLAVGPLHRRRARRAAGAAALPRTGRPRHHAGAVQPGGRPVVSSLRNLTETLEERKETRREVRTQLSQVTVTAYAVPVLGLGSLLLMNRDHAGRPGPR